MYELFFPFSFSFSIENEKNDTHPLPLPLFTPFWGGSSAASPLEIWDVMPPYLKTLFEQKQKFDNFGHFRPDDPLNRFISLVCLWRSGVCCVEATSKTPSCSP